MKKICCWFARDVDDFCWQHAAQPKRRQKRRQVETPAESGSIVDSREHTPDPLLTNKTWMWERRDPNGNQVPEIIVPNPENYTLFFNDDGTFNATIDCNGGNGRYATTPPGSIFMELGPTTQAACPDGSLSGDMINMFGPAQNYRFEEDNTVLVFVWQAAQLTTIAPRMRRLVATH